MFQKNGLEAGRVAPACNMSKTAVEHSFIRARRLGESRRNRSTAGDGMFSRVAARRG